MQMSEPKNIESHLWLLLFPILLIVLGYEYGIGEGVRRFAAFMYVGSFLLLVALLIPSMFERKFLAKSWIIATTTIVIAYGVFAVVTGNHGFLVRGAIFGVIVGSFLGLTFVFLLSPLATKVRSTEMSVYRRIRAWFNGKNTKV